MHCYIVEIMYVFIIKPYPHEYLIKVNLLTKLFTLYVNCTTVHQLYMYYFCFIRLINLICLIDASIFTIIPETQYVYLNHNVTFECATNLTGYTLSFNYIFSGESITPTLKNTNLPNGGIKVSTTFIVTHILNGTRVGCRADHSVNTPMLTSLANVFAQG